MSPIAIVLISLQGAVGAIRLVEGFITDPKVKTILEDIASAIAGAIGGLTPYHAAAVAQAKQG